jgi:hypothetical protein
MGFSDLLGEVAGMAVNKAKKKGEEIQKIHDVCVEWDDEKLWKEYNRASNDLKRSIYLAELKKRKERRDNDEDEY